MAGTIVVDRLESDASYASSINIASPVIVSNTFAFPTGSNTAPAITPSGDTNTGIFFPAADTIAFSEGGVESMRIDSSGNVGIGTTSPANALDVRSTAASAIRLSRSGTSGQITSIVFEDGSGTLGSANTTRIASDSGAMSFSTGGTSGSVTGGTERMRLTSAGLLQFNSGYGSVATAYGCRAWVNFNGSGTISIRASGNVSSISDAGEMYYGLNFSTAMPDANYAWFANGSNVNNDAGTNYTGYSTTTPGNNQTTSYLYIRGLNIYASGANQIGDPPLVTVGIIR
jgi:hypothetical protein